MSRAIGRPRSSTLAVLARGAGVVAVLVLAAAPWTARAAEPTAPKTSLGSRFYAGVDVAAIHYNDTYGDVAFGGSSIGLGLYAGFHVNDKLSVELSYNETTAIDKHDVEGSGVKVFNVETELHTVSASVVRQLYLRDLFNLPRDWRVYGQLGVFENNLDRTVTDLASYAQASQQEKNSGVLAGMGMLYRLGRFDLRGGLRFWGEAHDLDFAAQFRF
ncbi:MAG TPA: outer membrane beta-barrel protein [Gammaproteobacteria bacterium]|nr:outer membrane beta-barrel protein [Gammaproteobacteria bacterium]